MFYLHFQLSHHTKQMFYWAVYSDSLLFYPSDGHESSTVCEHLNVHYLAFINPEIQLFLSDYLHICKVSESFPFNTNRH